MKSWSDRLKVVLGLVMALCVIPGSANECVKVIGFDWSIPHKIDPANADSQADSLHIWGVYEPLIWIDEDYNFVPWLAESWEANSEGTVWTFHLRKGVKFHDGSDFDADDVVYTFRRIKDPATGSPGAGGLARRRAGYPRLPARRRGADPRRARFTG